MQYQGGKNRIAKEIARFINNHPYETYYEPFVGGASILEKITKQTRIASDADKDLIILWQAVQQGWTAPTTLTEEQHAELKNSPPSPLRTFAKYSCSWGGKAWGGYAKNTAVRNYAQTNSRTIQQQAKHIQDVTFKHSHYNQLDIKPESIIYCDPPYSNTTGYKEVGAFDHEAFWDWAREQSKQNMVFISELTAPNDFKPIWQKLHKTEMNKPQQRIEKLYIHQENPHYTNTTTLF